MAEWERTPKHAVHEHTMALLKLNQVKCSEKNEVIEKCISHLTQINNAFTK